MCDENSLFLIKFRLIKTKIYKRKQRIKKHEKQIRLQAQIH